ELDIGHQLAMPGVIFQETTRPQFLSSQSALGGGQYHLFVPLMRQDSVVGYIRLSLRSQHIAHLYSRARHQVALAALIGLTCITPLGFTLHVQLSRRGAALARTLEATVRGEALPEPRQKDEFSQVLEAAGKLGRELMQTRERSTQAQRRVSALANFM